MKAVFKCRALFTYLGTAAALLILTTFITVTLIPPVHANNLDDAQSEKQDLDQKIQDAKKNLQAQKSREEQLREELGRLDRQLEEIRAEINRLNRDIMVKDEQIQVTEALLLEAEEQLDYRESLLSKRLRVIYERGTVSYLEVLMSSSSFREFLTILYDLRTIAEKDLQLLEEVQEERDRVMIRKEELEAEKYRLHGMRNQLLTRKGDLDRTVSSRGVVLSELQQEIRRTNQAIQKMEDEAEQLAKLIEQLRREREGSRPEGALLWPVESPWRVSSEFGWRRNPFGGGTVWHGGLDIATYGVPRRIFAAAGGTVILSQYYGSYGYTAIIDHGGGLETLYAHCSALYVSVGQTVIRGQHIANTGTTGSSTGIHLHFEVRDYNRPPISHRPSWDRRHNPREYL